MASIDTYLEAILSATYGRQVRSSIHDAIQAMNTESGSAASAATSAQTTANTALTNAATAQSTADNAASAASAAQTTADTAVTNAATAQSAAESAATAAQAAQTTANTAVTNAAAAQTAADNAAAAAATANGEITGLKPVVTGNANAIDGLADALGVHPAYTLILTEGTSIDDNGVVTEPSGTTPVTSNLIRVPASGNLRLTWTSGLGKNSITMAVYSAAKAYLNKYTSSVQMDSVQTITTDDRFTEAALQPGQYVRFMWPNTSSKYARGMVISDAYVPEYGNTDDGIKSALASISTLTGNLETISAATTAAQTAADDLKNATSKWDGIDLGMHIVKVDDICTFNGSRKTTYHYIVLSAESFYASTGSNETASIPEEAFDLGSNLIANEFYAIAIEIINPAESLLYDQCRIAGYVAGNEVNWITSNIATTNEKGFTNGTIFQYDGSRIALMLRLKGNVDGLKIKVSVRQLLKIDLSNTEIEQGALKGDNSIAFDSISPATYPRRITSLIPLPNGLLTKQMLHNGYGYGNYRAIVFYDSDKVAIGSAAQNNTPGIVAIPETAAYFRLSAFYDNIPAGTNYGFFASFPIRDDCKDQYVAQMMSLDDDIFIDDLLCGLSWTHGKAIRVDNGSEDDDAEYHCTGFVRIPDDLAIAQVGSYAYTSTSFARCAFYTAAKEYISGISDTSTRMINVSIPEGAAYIRVTTHTSILPGQAMLCAARIVDNEKSKKNIYSMLRSAIV